MTETIDPQLRNALNRIACVPQLLVTCDYDGTLAPIVSDPTMAAPSPEAATAIRSLAALPQTTVAVVSSRSLRDLAALSRLPSEVHLVGSHGSEFDVGFVERLTPELVALRDRLDDELADITRGAPGIRLERKPASVAVHLRGATPEVADNIAEAVRSGPAAWPDIHVTTGKQVIELSVIATNKGIAIDALRTQICASAVLYLGDDATDEDAFAQLRGLDVGIKIGSGETRAGYCVEDAATARVLALVLQTRRNWLFGERAVPIERHSMLSNGHTVALIGPDSRISWLCHPSPDSSAVFADLLGGRLAGHFTVGPADRGGIPLGQRYRSGTMTVETRWPGLTVTDWLDESGSLMRVLTGSGRAHVEFAPRPEFGQVQIQLQPLGEGLLVLGPNEPIALRCPGIEWEIRDDGGNDTATATVALDLLGGRIELEMRFASTSLERPSHDALHRQEATELRWREWSESLRLPRVSRELVLRSALTLRGLRHMPTGAILAAATTSLPEEFGGVRNWDYRYCWLRDGAMAARALVDLGSLDEASAFLDWVYRIIGRSGGHPERLHPLYTVDGFDLGPEAVIETLPGYAGSRPVRIGNAANRQVQLDVFGPISDLIAAVAALRGSVLHHEWDVIKAMVQAVDRRWHEPDHGIWEARLAPRHHVHSKVMCWMTVDRALQLIKLYGKEPRPDWEELRERIADNVLTHGWNESVGAYTVAYGEVDMDAASLWIGLSGLLEDDDPRFLATVLKTEAELRSGPTVYRYKWDDGLPGREGGFHICAAWMVEAYLRTGRRADAEELFDQLLDTAGPTGLLPEQYDPEAERGLGNHPQAYSHLGLIRCALLLSED